MWEEEGAQKTSWMFGRMVLKWNVRKEKGWRLGWRNEKVLRETLLDICYWNVQGETLDFVIKISLPLSLFLILSISCSLFSLPSSSSSNVSCRRRSPHQNVRKDERSVALNSTNWLDQSSLSNLVPSSSFSLLFFLLSPLLYFSIFCKEIGKTRPWNPLLFWIVKQVNGKWGGRKNFFELKKNTNLSRRWKEILCSNTHSQT